MVWIFGPHYVVEREIDADDEDCVAAGLSNVGFEHPVF